MTEYNELYAEQGGRCLICGQHRPDHGSGGLLVDHDHETGKVRGLLCVRCNTRMSAVDDRGWLEKALKYRNGFIEFSQRKRGREAEGARLESG